MVLEIEIEGNQGKLLAYLSQSTSRTKHGLKESQMLVLSFGLPVAKPVNGTDLFHRELVERIANHSGWLVLSVVGSGIGASQGRFSPMNWADDISAGVNHLVEAHKAKSVLIGGYDLSADISMYVAGSMAEVRGVATISLPVSLDQYIGDPHLLARKARSLGVRIPTVSSEIDRWSEQLMKMDPKVSANLLHSKQWLVIHGRDDHDVTEGELRDFIGTSGSNAEVHFITSADHMLAADPRMAAVLLGWMEMNGY